MPNDQPVLTITEAARASGVDRRTLRRRLDGGEFPNAYRESGSHGTESGAWLIPVEDLLRAGLSLDAPTGPDTATVGSHGRSEQEPLQSALADALRRAEVAEATAAERQRIIETQELALRALAAAVELKDAVPVEVIARLDDSPDGREPEASAEPDPPDVSGSRTSVGLSDAEPSEAPHDRGALTDHGRPEESGPVGFGPGESEPEVLAEPDRREEVEPEEVEPEESAGPTASEAMARPVPAILPGAPSRPTPPWVPVSTPPVQRRWWQRKYR